MGADGDARHLRRGQTPGVWNRGEMGFASKSPVESRDQEHDKDVTVGQQWSEGWTSWERFLEPQLRGGVAD